MNVYDSQRMLDSLSAEGFEQQNEPENADLIILNTCHIREKASEKMYSELGRLRANRRAKVVVAGCVAQAEGEEILARAKNVDFVLGPQALHRLPKLLRENIGHNRTIDNDFPVETKFENWPSPVFHKASSFLTIQEGCDKFCSFCVVPYTRGSEYSRPASAVIREARTLVEGGTKEITLLGQNVNAYNGCSGGLGGLIKALDEIDGLDRIRFTTSHPRDMSDALINAFGEVDSLMPYLHLPVQSGSDRVLDRMNRRHDVEHYEKTISKIRAIRPDIAISSDFIVGHPGETEADFVETLKLADRVGFAQAYSFKYSARPGTPAAADQDQVSEQSKTERIARLQGLLGQHQKSFNEKFVGSLSKILLDRTGRLSDQLAGRSPHNQSVHVKVPPKNFSSLLGKIVLVRITKANQNSLTAELVREGEVKLPEVPV